MDEDWVNSTFNLLGSFDTNMCKPYSIPMVPEELRKGSEKAHEPKVVSIGPRFQGRKELVPMEENKLRCMIFLLERSQLHGEKFSARELLGYCMKRVSDFESAIRTSYAAQIQLESFDLGTIIHDACFLLELLISQSTEWNSRLGSDSMGPSLATQLGNMEFILSDITLLENQIPLFLLPVLFNILFPSAIDSSDYHHRKEMHARIMADLVLLLFGNTHDPSSKSIPYNSSASTPDPIDASHILELVHSSFILSENNQHIQQSSSVDVVVDIDVYANKPIKPKRCATRLLAAGVTLVKSEDNSFIPKFSTGVLQIPHLCITQTMEARWRSFIAWELHTNKWKKSVGIDMFTLRALLFNDLICCASDVQLLKNKGIIVDKLGMSNRDLVHFFGSLTNGIDRGLVQSTYCNMIHALNTYPAAGSIIRFHIILWHYLGRFFEWLHGLTKFLKRGYNFAAALITLLTVIQTCYAILSYHYPKN